MRGPFKFPASGVTFAIAFSLVLAATARSGIAQRSGCSLRYDGIDDQVVVPNTGALPDDVFTVTAWIRTSSSALQSVVTRGEDDVTDVQPWGFGVFSGHIYLQIEEDGTFRVPVPRKAGQKKVRVVARNAEGKRREEFLACLDSSPTRSQKTERIEDLGVRWR